MRIQQWKHLQHLTILTSDQSGPWSLDLGLGPSPCGRNYKTKAIDELTIFRERQLEMQAERWGGEPDAFDIVRFLQI